MAWTSPRTWVTSELVTAALMNVHVRDNLSHLYSNFQLSLPITAIDDTDSPYSAAVDTSLVVDCSGGATTVNLPAVSGNSGKIIQITHVGSTNSITIDGSGAETIDGETTQALDTQYDTVTLLCDGSEWYIM